MGGAGEIDAVVLARLRDASPETNEHLESTAVRTAVAAVSAASRSLARLMISEPSVLSVLHDLGARAPAPSTSASDLVAWKRCELLRIAARDLTAIDSVDETGRNLARLACDVVRRAVEIAGADGLVVIAMGKLGGAELNYSSDIDLMFSGDCEEKAARRVLDITRQCFRTDVNLRPEGRNGPLVRTLQSYCRYWQEWAQPWEFQALLKARPVAGAPDAMDEWSKTASNHLWSKQFGYEEIRSVREMKARSEAVVRQKGMQDSDVKHGIGGIRDVEFAVQLLQLVHGRYDEAIRSPTTVDALGELADGGYVTNEDAAALAGSYRYLRTVEHRLQLVEEQQTHTVPKERNERLKIATVLGYRDTPQHGALDAFSLDLARHQAGVRQAHQKLYFRPLLEAFAAGSKPDESTEKRLEAFGFTDADRTRQAIRELTTGLARSSRLMTQMMPLLLDWLSESPDPDSGLLGLRKLIADFRSPNQIVGVFRESPETAQRICTLLGSGKRFAFDLLRTPNLIDDLASNATLIPTEDIATRIQHNIGWRKSLLARRQALVRFTHGEIRRIACADIVDAVDERQASQWRSRLADAVVKEVLEDLCPQVPIALVAMGRYGGQELAYASDLDLILVHDADPGDSTAQAEAERIARQLLSSVGGSTPAQRLYVLDYDLRPEGSKGVLSRSVEGCRSYYERWASTWERQALLRARFVGGDEGVGAGFFEAIEHFVWGSHLTDDELREIRHLKARMERERIPRNQDPQFHLKLGPGALSDVEWTVQLLALQHQVRATSTLEALDTLRDLEIIDNTDHYGLLTSWSFCDRVRNRAHLVGGYEVPDSLPSDGSTLARLAYSLGTSPGDLREHYRRSSRRARKITERLFYGE